MVEENAINHIKRRISIGGLRLSATRLRDMRDGYLFIMPWLLGFLIFTAGPMAYSVFAAFTDYDLVTRPTWVGLQNVQHLFQDPLFLKSLGNTAFYTFLSVPLNLMLALGAALLLREDSHGVRVLRLIYYLPSVIPSVAMSMLWVWIFNPEFGLLNAVIRQVLGIRGPLWLFDPNWAKPALILMGFWGVGWGMVIFLAGLSGIPGHLYEAAAIDGAGSFAQFMHITLPMLTPTIFFNLVMGIIGSFQVFTSAFIMTRGGPGNATLFAVLYLYRNAFENFRMGYSSCIAWVLFAIISGFTILQFDLARRWVYYEAGDLAR